jgi:DNA-binding NarL/FixJ family response regulator
MASCGDGRRALTPREREVLGLMVSAPSNRDIARQLHISEATVKHHVHSMLEKLNATSRTQLVARLARPRSIVTG